MVTRDLEIRSEIEKGVNEILTESPSVSTCELRLCE